MSGTLHSCFLCDYDSNNENKSNVSTFINEVLCFACAFLVFVIVLLLSNALAKGFPAKTNPREPDTTTQDRTEYNDMFDRFSVYQPLKTMLLQFTSPTQAYFILIIILLKKQ